MDGAGFAQGIVGTVVAGATFAQGMVGTVVAGAVCAHGIVGTAVRRTESTLALTAGIENGSRGDVDSLEQPVSTAAASRIASVARVRNVGTSRSMSRGDCIMPTSTLRTAHGAGTTLTGWETVVFPLTAHSNSAQPWPHERVVAALVRDRHELARLREALKPSLGVPQTGILHAFERIDALDSALQRMQFDVLVIEPTDGAGQPTDAMVRSIRERFPRLSVLGHVMMKPGMSSQVLTFARAGVHELIVAGIDDSAMILRHALQRASRRCLAEEVFTAVNSSLPRKAAALVRYCLEHASESPSIDDISRALGVHRRTLVNRMQQAMLPPPSELWAWSRVLLAARYLEMPGRSVEWVAHTVGYPSANALRNALKKYTGMAPSELREDDGFARAMLTFRTALLLSARQVGPMMTPARLPRRAGSGGGAAESHVAVRQAV